MKSKSTWTFRLERLERRDVLTGGFDWVPALTEFPPAIVGNDFTPLADLTPARPPIVAKPEPSEPPVQTWPTGPGQPTTTPGSYLPGTYLTADLTAPSGSTTGYASYQTTTTSAFHSATFRVTVQAATPNTSLLVVVDDTIVGEIDTDGAGFGTLLLTSNLQTSFDAPPSVHDGSTITVGPLTGTFSADPQINN